MHHRHISIKYTTPIRSTQTPFTFTQYRQQKPEYVLSLTMRNGMQLPSDNSSHPIRIPSTCEIPHTTRIPSERSLAISQPIPKTISIPPRMQTHHQNRPESHPGRPSPHDETGHIPLSCRRAHEIWLQTGLVFLLSKTTLPTRGNRSHNNPYSCTRTEQPPSNRTDSGVDIHCTYATKRTNNKKSTGAASG